MIRFITMGSLAAVALVVFALCVALLPSNAAEEMPFGGEEDVEFASRLWQAIKDHGEWEVFEDVYASNPPHGMFVRSYYETVSVDGWLYPVVIKDNFGGEGATLETVSASPEKYLAAVTVMLRREDGYDPDTNNWFWVKYQPDGSVEVNPDGMALAGRVAKGMATGCIACHRLGAGGNGNDYIFSDMAVGAAAAVKPGGKRIITWGSAKTGTGSGSAR